MPCTPIYALEELVAPDYVGHTAAGDRDLAEFRKSIIDFHAIFDYGRDSFVIEDQFVEGGFRFGVRAGVANQLAVEVHGIIAARAVEHDLFAVGGVGGGHSGGLSLLHSGNLLPVL
mgnify:CR=1 FL=1